MKGDADVHEENRTRPRMEEGLEASSVVTEPSIEAG
jgi:hypothetical protein